MSGQALLLAVINKGHLLYSQRIHIFSACKQSHFHEVWRYRGLQL